MGDNANLGYETRAINERLSWILAAAMALGFTFGYRAILKQRRYFKKAGLTAQIRMLNRRIAMAVVFTLAMLTMLALYLDGFGTVSVEAGTDTILLAAIFPAFAILPMFFWMLASANRFQERFTPRLGQIDHEVAAFGKKALERRYQGVLLVFDLAGMKLLNQHRGHSDINEHAVDHLLQTVEKDLTAMIQTGRVTFKYKSNGDEFIFAMRAADLATALALFVELLQTWRLQAESHMEKWRTQLATNLTPSLGKAAAEKLAASIDPHVLMTTMHEMKITVKGGIDRPEAAPDLISPRFTALSALFKPSRWNKIAVFADDAALLSATEDQQFSESDEQPTMGFVAWDASVAPSPTLPAPSKIKSAS